MDWNLGAIITLGLSLIGSIVWIIRLEGKVKSIERTIHGDMGVCLLLKEIKTELKDVRDNVIVMKSNLQNLIDDHNKKTGHCSNYKSETLE